jgi:hypothetical protein
VPYALIALASENDSMGKERYMPFTLNQSNELFDEEAALKRHNVISIRRVSLPRKGENWEISENGRKVLILRGARLTNKEKGVLRTVEGIRLIIEEYKAGNRSVNKIKAILKKHWKKP